jgi:P4 family phage/plasmid primase-like protien
MNAATMTNGRPTSAVAWRDRSGELADWVEGYLVNRADCCGQYAADGKSFTGKDPLRRIDIARHFRGGRGDAIGIHSTARRDDGSCWCRWVAVDIDRHDDETDPAKNLAAAMVLHARAAALGFRVMLLDSNGAGGYHLWVVFARPVPSHEAHAFVGWLARDLGLDADPETFPKQARLTPPGERGQFGNWIRVPGRHHKRDHWTRVWDGSGWLEGDEAIEFLLATEGDSPDLIPAEAIAGAEAEPKPSRPRAPLSEDEAEDEIVLAKKALGFLHPDDDYDEWVKVGMALKGKFGEAGFDLWDEWSARGSAYKDGECREKWATFGSDGRVTMGSIYKRAMRAGFEFPKLNIFVGQKSGDGGAEDEGKASVGKGRSRPTTDLGNAERMAAKCGDRVRYVHAWKKWLVWDGSRWKIDGNGAAVRLAKKVVRSIYAEARDETDAEKAKKLASWAYECEARSRIDAMLALAASEEGIAIEPDRLDTDPWLLNCKNGTIDLRTGKLRPHDRADLITKVTPVDFDAGAECPLFAGTLKTFLVADELVAFWQRLLGMSVAGVVEDHVLPICWGDGSNGKSTLLGAHMDTLGDDYAMKAAPDLLTVKKHDSHPTERADLFGKRVVVANETDEGVRLSEALVKELTGGDKIRARRMNENFWEFRPTHTAFLVTNHKPEVRGQDNGIWRRVMLIPFTVQMTKEKEVKGMDRKLLAEREGILAWLVRGCVAWQKEGLNPPPVVTAATAEYKAEEDRIGHFLEDHVQTYSDPGVRARCSEVYARYRKWAEDEGIRPASQTRFGKDLAKRGIQRETSGCKWYVGVALRPLSEVFGGASDGDRPF